MLLHKSFLLVLYCEKLVLDFERFPRDYKKYVHYIKNGFDNYWKNIFWLFECNAGQYFK